MPEDLGSFVRRLLLATERGQIEWGPTSDDPGAFVATAGAGSVRVSLPQVDEGISASRLELLDSDGRVTDSLQTDPTRAGPWLDWEEALNALYSAAHLAGSGTSKVIEGLAKEWDLPPDPKADDVPF